ncbi:uncharacterized protein LOC105426109 [Pogonomyrmex barbatus]|uniref:Uncharacterized protein LOC105426109 n=1 Tax=Pogonomyrmex barbatus TaxID=144034 RepID=A0A6I9WUD2_9HYME|nr:uncharacterized protein LOC105426109 [Pogonomyrmex barbatus]
MTFPSYSKSISSSEICIILSFRHSETEASPQARQSGNYPSPRTSEVLTHAEETTSCSSRRPYYLYISPPSYSPIRPSESGSPPDFSALFPERHDTNLQIYPDLRTQKSLDEFCELRTASLPPLDLTIGNPTSSPKQPHTDNKIQI